MLGITTDILVNIAASIVASAVLLFAGFLWGKVTEKRRTGRNLETYEFYPFKVNADGVTSFDVDAFRRGVAHFLRHRDYKAARQLIFIGEQHDVRGALDAASRKAYLRLFERYDGRSVVNDTKEFMENFTRIVRLIGQSFPGTGIEILLHNLADPGHSLVALENNVTGRRLGDGTTNLLIDLKRRQLAQQDKLNYELEIGARRFKCTTMPIIHPEHGIIGAVCINVDVNFLNDAVLKDKTKLEEFFRALCHTDMRLEENILSKDERARALAGKRHFQDHTHDAKGTASPTR